MAKLSILAGTTSKTIKVFIQNNTVTTGAGLTGLVFNTSGLTAYYIREGASSTTSITLATATLGTWATGGFIVVDGTNMPGMYELGIPNLALAAGAKSVVLYLQGAASMFCPPIEIELTAVDNQSTAFGLSLAKTTNITGFNDIAASAVVSSGAITTSGGAVSTVTTVTNQLTAAAVATGVWQDSTAGDFTTASSIGKSLYIANVVPGAAGGHFIAGANAATSITTALTANITGNVSGTVGTAAAVTGAVGSVTGNVSGTVGTATAVTGSVGSVVGLTASNLDTTVSSRMATYTQPTGFLAATFPTGTVANTTNITAGTITTTTNLTNAPTAGDFTATMKTSIGTAVAASAVASVTGNVGGNVTGSVGSVVGAVGSVTGNVGGNVTGSVGSVTSPVTLGTVNSSASNIKINTALNSFSFVMLNSTTNAPQTGLTVTATRSINGGAFSACTNAVSEIANGWYTINLSASDLNGNTIALRFTASGASDTDILVITQP